MAAAPPFVAYSTLTETLVPAADWPAVYASLQALKGHVQEYPGVQRFDVFTRVEEGEPGDGEGLLMEEPEERAERQRRPARPLFGYRDVGEDVRWSRQAQYRAWVILAVMIALSLGWTLTVYFIEPGLR